MDIYSAIRIRAYRSVQSPDKDYLLRQMIRWYSKTFYTPIATVEEMPIEDITQAWYEEKYSQMDSEELAQEKTELLTTPEERAQAIEAEEAEEASLWEVSRMVAQEEAKKKAEALAKKDGIASIQHKTQPLRAIKDKEADLPELAKLAPPIEMTFVSEDEFEKEIESFEEFGKKIK